MSTTEKSPIEVPTLHSFGPIANNSGLSKCSTTKSAAVISGIGAVIVFSTATIILGNSIHLDRTYGHERVSTVLVTTIAIFLTLMQFFICFVTVMAKNVPTDLLWVGHLVVATGLTINIFFALANGMHKTYLGFNLIEFCSLNAGGAVIFASCLKLHDGWTREKKFVATIKA